MLIRMILGQTIGATTLPVKQGIFGVCWKITQKHKTSILFHKRLTNILDKPSI